MPGRLAARLLWPLANRLSEPAGRIKRPLASAQRPELERRRPSGLSKVGRDGPKGATVARNIELGGAIFVSRP